MTSTDIPASRILSQNIRNGVILLLLLGAPALAVVKVLPTGVSRIGAWVITGLACLYVLPTVVSSVIMPVVVTVLAIKERHSLDVYERREMQLMYLASVVALTGAVAAVAICLWMWRSL